MANQWIGPLISTLLTGNPVPGIFANAIGNMSRTNESGQTGWQQLGGLITGTTLASAQAENQKELNEQQQAFNSAEAEKNRQWEEQMRDSSITSAWNQYKSLGVNPLLALDSGNGVTSAASTAATSGNGTAALAQNQTGSLAMASAVGISAILNAVARVIAKK